MSGRSKRKARVSIPKNVKKLIREIKERTGSKHSNEDVFAMLRDCNMNTKQVSEKLLSQVGHMESKSKQIDPDAAQASSTNGASDTKPNSSEIITKLPPTTCSETSDGMLKNKLEKLQLSQNQVILPSHIQALPQELCGITFGSFNSTMLNLINKAKKSEDSALSLPFQFSKENKEGIPLSILKNSTTDLEEFSLHLQAVGHIDETALSVNTNTSPSISVVHESGDLKQDSDLTHGALPLSTLTTVPAPQSSTNDLLEASNIAEVTLSGCTHLNSGRSPTDSASTSALVNPQDADLTSRSAAILKQTARVVQEVFSLRLSDYPTMQDRSTCQLHQSESQNFLCRSATPQRHPSFFVLPPLAYNAVHEGYGLYLPHPIGHICFHSRTTRCPYFC